MNAKNLLIVFSFFFFQSTLHAQNPNWTVNPANFQYTASMIAQLHVDGALNTGNNTIAIFVGAQVRGVGQPIPNTGGLYFLTIYSNTVTGEALTLKTWLPAQNAVLNIVESFTFTANQFWGTPQVPVQLHAWSDGDVPISMDAVPAQLAIRPGNWLPLDLAPFLNQEDNDPVVWTVVSSANLTASFAGSILTVTANDPNWTGTQSITVTATEQTANHYAASQAISFTRLPGYYQPEWDSIPSQAIDTTQTFTSFDLDDYVKDTYAGTCLKFAYQLDSFAAGTDVLPAWSVNPSAFSYSMTVIGQAVLTPAFVFENPGDRLAAFIGNTLVGVAAPVPVNGSNLYFLTVFANAVDSVSFRFFSAEKQRLYRLPKKLLFQPAGEVGSIDVPYLFDVSPLKVTIGSGNVVSILRRDPHWIGWLSFRFSVAECAYPTLSNDTIVANFSVGLVEICNGIDDDADTHVDEGLRSWFYLDNDGDSFGDGNLQLACPDAPNIADDNTDCDDTNAAIFPGATEICNSLDDDCDLLVDSDDPGIFDITPPVAACKNIPLFLDAGGLASLTPGDIDDGSSDACGIAILDLSHTSFDCDNVGANIVTLTVHDNNGLTSTCTATVNVQDTLAPVPVCQNISIQYNANAVASFAPADIFNAAASMDNCGGMTLLSASLSTFNCNESGTYLVTLTANDQHGNMGSCTAIVVVQPFVTVSNVQVTLANCNNSNGSIAVTASVPGSGQLGFSLNGGASWQFSGAFQSLPGGFYEVTMQVFGSASYCLTAPLQVPLSEVGGATWYKDFDGDGYSDGTILQACNQPSGWFAAGNLVATNGDCNDSNPGIHPGAAETCNGLDDDCSGNAESLVNTWTGSGGNTNWSDAGNWSDGIVPLACQDVVVPAGNVVKVIAAFHAVGRTLDVPQSALLTVELTGTLTIQN